MKSKFTSQTLTGKNTKDHLPRKETPLFDNLLYQQFFISNLLHQTKTHLNVITPHLCVA